MKYSKPSHKFTVSQDSKPPEVLDSISKKINRRSQRKEFFETISLSLKTALYTITLASLMLFVIHVYLSL